MPTPAMIGTSNQPKGVFFMKQWIQSSLILFAAMNNGLAAAETFKDPTSGVEFPSEVTVNEEGKDVTLSATGVDTRKKFFVKVYSIAHYMQDPIKGDKDELFAEIFTDGKPKQLTTKWIRGVDANKIRSEAMKSFQKIVPKDQLDQIQGDLDTYLGFYDADINAGDTHEVIWLPGGKVEVIVNGQKKGEITSDDFAKNLWSIWLGPKSIVNRDQMVKFDQ